MEWSVSDIHQARWGWKVSIWNERVRTWATFSVTLCRIFCIGKNIPCFVDDMALCVSFSEDFFSKKSLMLVALFDILVRYRDSSESLDAWLSKLDWWWFPVTVVIINKYRDHNNYYAFWVGGFFTIFLAIFRRFFMCVNTCQSHI